MISERRGVLQLKRLEMLMDVVFALIIWRIFMILPRPEGENSQWASVLEMLQSDPGVFLLILLSTVIVIVFWLQNNDLLGKLKQTDSIHTAITIFQLIFLLLMLYSIGLGIRYEGELVTKVMESVSALLVGLMAYLGWRYAMYKAKILADDVTEEEAKLTLEKSLAEPITAAITIPFAFVGPLAWELSWLIYPLIKAWFNRRHKQHSTEK